MRGRTAGTEPRLKLAPASADTLTMRRTFRIVGQAPMVLVAGESG